MKKNVYTHELRRKVRSVLVWGGGILLIHLLYLSFYPAFARDAALFNQVMTSFPPEFREAFGLRDVDLSAVLGFYTFVFLFVQVCLAVQAGNYGFGLLSIEESELTADFLMTKPVSRSQIFFSKVLAGFTALTFTNALVWVFAFGLIAVFRDGRPYEGRVLALLLGSIVFFQAFFFSVGLAISLLVRRVRNVTPYGLGLGLGMYVLGAFSGLMGDIELEWVTPFRHFDGAYIVGHQAYDMPLFWLDVGVTAAAFFLAYVRYLRRDIACVA